VSWIIAEIPADCSEKPGWSYFCIRYADTKILWGLQGNPYGPCDLGFFARSPGKKRRQKIFALYSHLAFKRGGGILWTDYERAPEGVDSSDYC
jgi:hypothetical protein